MTIEALARWRIEKEILINLKMGMAAGSIGLVSFLGAAKYYCQHPPGPCALGKDYLVVGNGSLNAGVLFEEKTGQIRRWEAQAPQLIVYLDSTGLNWQTPQLP